MALTRRPIPTDPAIPRRHLPGGRAEAECAQDTTIPAQQIAQLRAGQRGVAQIMPARYQGVPQPRVRARGDGVQMQPNELPHRTAHRDRLGQLITPRPQRPGIAIAIARRRQRDQPRTVQTQQPHPAAHHLQTPLHIDPVQRRADPPRDLGALRRIGLTHRRADDLQIRRAQRPPTQLANRFLAHRHLPHRW